MRLRKFKFPAPDTGPIPDSGGGSAPASTPAAAPAPSGPSSVGPAPAANYDHKFGNQPSVTVEQASRVRSVLDKGPDETLSTEDIAALLNFNPPMGAKPVESTAQAPAPAAAPAAPPVPAPAAAPAQPALSPDAQAILQALKPLAQAPAAPANPQAPAAPEAPKVRYGGEVPALQVTQELVQALFTPNPQNPNQQAEALNVLTNGIMNQVWGDAQTYIKSELTKMATALVAHIPQAVQSHHTGQTNAEKFYAKFPELNKPMFKGLVNTAYQKLAQAKAAAGPFEHNDAFFDEMGHGLLAFVEAQSGMKLRAAAPNAAPNLPPRPIQVPVAAQPQAQAQARPGTFYTPANGSRPPAGPGGSSVGGTGHGPIWDSVL